MAELAGANPDWTSRESDPNNLTCERMGVTLRLWFSRETIGGPPGQELLWDNVRDAIVMLGDKPLVDQGIALELAALVVDRLDMVDDEDIRVECEEPPQVA